MLVKVPYIVHMDAVVDTVSGTVQRVEVHGDTVFLNRDRGAFPVQEVGTDRQVSDATARVAIRIAESEQWPAWQ